MFNEVRNVSQIKGEPRRRWFDDKDLELIVWFDERDNIVGFQLCYEIDNEPKALTWQEGRGYLHTGIDDGNSYTGPYKPTPILVRDGMFDKETVEKRFASSSAGLPKEIADFITAKLAEYKGHSGPIQL